MEMLMHHYRSSGSTNHPKPIRFSNRYLICVIQSLNLNAINSCPSMVPTEQDIALPSLPLYVSVINATPALDCINANRDVDFTLLVSIAVLDKSPLVPAA